MKKNRLFKLSLAALGCAVAALAGASRVNAASITYYWDTNSATALQGGDGIWDNNSTFSWNTAANGATASWGKWTNDIANSIADFRSNTLATASRVVLGSDIYVFQLVLPTANPAKTIIDTNGAATYTLHLGGGTHANAAIITNVNVSLDHPAVGFSYSGSGNQGITIYSPVSGSGGVLLTSSGFGSALSLFNTNSSFTGVVNFNGGTMNLNVLKLANGGFSSSLGASSSSATNLLLYSRTTGGALVYTGPGDTTDRLFTLNGGGSGQMINNGSGALNFTSSGAIALAGSGVRQLQLAGSNTGDNTLTPALGDGTGGVTTLVKTGAGKWVLAGANTFTGKTLINQGTLGATSLNSLGAPAAGMIGLGSTTSAGTLLYTGPSGTTDRLIALSGTSAGGTVDQSGSGTLTISSLKGTNAAGAKTLTLQGSSSGVGLITGVLEDVLGSYSENVSANFPAGTNKLVLKDVNFCAVGATISGAAFNSPTFITNVSGTTVTLDQPTIGALASNAVVTVSGGAVSLVKAGTGAWILSAANTYSGTTKVTRGRLIGVTDGGAANSVVTVSPATNTTGTLGISVTANASQWPCAGLAFNTNSGASGVGLDFNFGSVVPGTSVAPLQVNGNLDFTATPVVTVEAGNLPAGTGMYPLITWTGTFSGTAPTAVTLAGAATGELVLFGNTLYLNITGNAGPLKWAAGSGVWDINVTADWQNSLGGAAKYQQATIPGNAVIFEDTVSGATPITVSLNTSVSPAAVTADHSVKDYTISGSGQVAGTVGLIKSGSGTLTLATANSYSGGTTLSGGQLNLNHGGSSSTNSAIGTGPLTIQAGTTLDNTSGAEVALRPVIAQNWNGDFTYAGSAHSLDLGSGAVTLNADRQVTVTANTLTVGGSISGAFGLTKLGDGNLKLGGGNAFSGATSVGAGTLWLANSNALQASTLTSGGILFDSTVSSHAFALGGLSGGFDLALQDNAGAPNPVSLSVGANNSSQSYFGALSGAGSLAKAGTGFLSLSGASTFTGGVTLKGGTVAVDGAETAGTSGPLGLSGAISFQGGTLQFSANNFFDYSPRFSSVAGQIFNLHAGGQAIALASGLASAGGQLNVFGGGSFALAGTNTFNGVTLVSANTVLQVVDNGKFTGGGPLTLGQVNGNPNAGKGTLQYDSSAASTFGDVIVGNGTAAPGALNQTGGTITCGNMTLNNGFSGGAPGTVNVTGGTLNVNGTLVGSSQVSGATALSTIDVSGGAALWVGNGLRLTGNPSTGRYAQCTFTQTGGAVTVAGGLTLARTTAGNAALRTGIYSLLAGMLSADQVSQEVGPDTVGTFNFGGGTLRATTNAALFMTGLTAANVQTAGAVIDDGGYAVTIDQPLVEDAGLPGGGLTKLGAGTLTLSGTNTYTGSTVVSNGTLRINGEIAAGAVSVASGATLGGTGVVFGPVMIAAGGALAPGASVGTLTINNDLTLNGNLVFEVNKTNFPATNDYVVVTGSLVNAGAGILTLSNLGPSLVVGDSFRLFSKPLVNGNTLTIVPPSGVTFANRLAVDGTVQVLTASSIPSYPTNITTSVSGSTLTISWPATHLGWILQNQTNPLNVGLATNWVDIAGTASVTSTNFTINPATPTAFFRLRHP